MSSAETTAPAKASSTNKGNTIPLPASFTINHETAQLIIQQLINHRITTYMIPGAPRTLIKSECEKLLANYCQNNRTLLGPKFAKAPSIFSNTILSDLSQAIGTLIKTQVQQEQLGQAVVPTQEVLLQWAQEQKAWEALQKNAEQRPVPLSPYGSLKNQLERVQKFQLQLKQTSVAHLAEFLTPEEKQAVLTRVSEQIIKEVANQGAVSQNAITWTLEDLRDNDPLVSAALSKTAIEKLSKQVASLNPTEVQKIAQDQTALYEAAIAIAPTRGELVSQIGATLSISNKRAQEIVNRIEATAGPHHTQTEMQTLIIQSLTVRDRIDLGRQKITPEQFAKTFYQATRCYVTALPLAQPNANYANPLPITTDAQRWAKVLASQGLDVDHAVIENALRGISSSGVAHQIRLLEQQKLSLARNNRNTANIEAKIKRLTAFNNEFIALENKFKLLPRSLQQRINLAKISPSLKRWFEQINPLDWKFYQFHTPTVAASIEGRVAAIDGYIRHLERKPGIGLFLNPRYHWALQMRRNRLAWAKLVRRNISNRGLQRFIYYLPNKLLPSYWLRPAYWLRRGSGQALMWVGKKLGKSALGFALRKAGSSLINFTFKELFKKGFLALLGSAAAGPIGTAIGIAYTALSWGFQAIKFAFSPQGQYFIKKVLKSVVQAAAGALLGLYLLIAKFPLMLMGGGLGFAIAGPFGFLAGSTLGYLADSLISSLGGISNAVSGLAQGLGEALSLPNLAAGLTSTGSALAITSVVSIGGPLIAVGALTYLNHGATNASFIIPSYLEEFEEPAEAKYFIITKQANPQMNVSANMEITYTIVLDAKTDKISDIKITDKIDTNNMEIINIDNEGTFDAGSNTIAWPLANLEKAGTRISLTYKTKTKSQVNNKTKITNTVTAIAKVENETITRTSSVTLNSDASAVAQKAQEIIQGLQPGFWNYYNHHLSYDGNPDGSGEQDLFDDQEYNCCNDKAFYLPNHNHCYRSSTYPENCSGNPATISKGDAMFWCSWLVVKAFNETGHPMPAVLAVGTMKDWFESKGKYLSADTDISQLEPGYAVMFTAPSIEDGGKTNYWAHVGIICSIGSSSVKVCESNNYATLIKYNVIGGKMQGEGRLSVGGFGKP